VAHIEEVLCSKMFTVMDTARLFNLDYGTVYKIDHAVLIRLVQHLQIPDPINISVDEKSFKKGHQYVTIISDLDRGKALWVSTGNSKESLDEFFIILGPERCSKIKVVAKDNHRPYTASCNEYVPRATQVTDKFHLVQRLGKMLDDCRKEVVGDPNKPNVKLPKGLHWVLRHKEENLDPKNIPSLDKLKKLNEKLYEVYLLKEKFFILFNYGPTQIDLAIKFVNNWIQEAHELKLKALNEFIVHLRYHAHTILNILRTKLTSALSEGINRKITVIKQMAYGYRNINYFKLKILQRCGLLGSLYKNLTNPQES
jgi:transposase